jgi:hypothetical protein
MVCYRRSSEAATRAATGSCRNGRQAATPPYATASTPCGLVFSLNVEIRTSSYATWPMRGGAAPWHSRDVTDRGRSAGDHGGGTVIWHSPALPPRPAMLPHRAGTPAPSAGSGAALRSPPGRTGAPGSVGPAVGAHSQGPWHPCIEQNSTSSRAHGVAGETPALLSPPLRQDAQKNDRVAHILLLA